MLTNSAKGTVPAGTAIEFIDFSGVPQSKTLASTMIAGDVNMNLNTVLGLQQGYLAQIKGLKTYPADTYVTQVFTGNNTILLSDLIAESLVPARTIVLVDPVSLSQTTLFVNQQANYGDNRINVVSGVSLSQVGYLLRKVLTFGLQPASVVKVFGGNS